MSAIPANPTAVALPSMTRLDYSAAFLSYLVPGLGQMIQGRGGKGLLFLVGVYSLFFYGMALGQWHNVYFGETATPAQERANYPRVLINLYNRPQFAGQFWIGIALWPSMYHYW